MKTQIIMFSCAILYTLIVYLNMTLLYCRWILMTGMRSRSVRRFFTDSAVSVSWSFNLTKRSNLKWQWNYPRGKIFVIVHLLDVTLIQLIGIIRCSGHLRLPITVWIQETLLIYTIQIPTNQQLYPSSHSAVLKHQTASHAGFLMQLCQTASLFCVWCTSYSRVMGIKYTASVKCS